MINDLKIEPTKLAAILTILIMMGLCPSSAKALDHHSNSDKEKEIARQWLEKNYTKTAAKPLMQALLSQYFHPSSTLLPFSSNESAPIKGRIILSLMILQCENYSQLSYCKDAALENDLVRLNPENLFPYLLQFNHHVTTGDMSRALISLKKGLIATEVNDYYFDKVWYLRTELTTLGIQRKGANLLAEEFSGLGLDKIYNKIMPTCTENSKTSTEWASVCLKISDRLEAGTTFISNVVGAALRRDTLKAVSADEIKINAALTRRKFYNTFREEARLKLPTWDDPAQKPDSYYQNAVTFGELRAIQIMLDEASVLQLNK